MHRCWVKHSGNLILFGYKTFNKRIACAHANNKVNNATIRQISHNADSLYYFITRKQDPVQSFNDKKSFKSLRKIFNFTDMT